MCTSTPFRDLSIKAPQWAEAVIAMNRLNAFNLCTDCEGSMRTPRSVTECTCTTRERANIVCLGLTCSCAICDRCRRSTSTDTDITGTTWWMLHDPRVSNGVWQHQTSFVQFRQLLVFCTDCVENLIEFFKFDVDTFGPCIAFLLLKPCYSVC
jgi:hypothetical protein